MYVQCIYHVHRQTHIVCTYHKQVYTLYQLVHRMYVHYTHNYVILMYLYSTACLYSNSSEGVNLFCCSSSI